MVEENVADLAELRQLSGGELVEEMRADALDMVRRGRRQRGETLVGEHREGAPSIARATLATYPPEFFEASDGVREPASR